jgi:glycosyltransferase involved in cell wall biosynthesis
MAFNESASLAPFVGELTDVLRSLARPYEVIIVDDGSSDGTGAAADRLAEAGPAIRVIRHPENRGLGSVYRTGFAEARGTFVSFFPADGQFPASIVADFVPRAANADMVLGFLPSRDRPLLARSLSAAERLLYRLLFGPIPRFQGVMMFRRRILETMTLRSSGRGWAVLMELILRAQRAGCRIVSVPTEVRPRIAGRSKVNNVRTIGANLRQVLLLRWHLWH